MVQITISEQDVKPSDLGIREPEQLYVSSERSENSSWDNSDRYRLPADPFDNTLESENVLLDLQAYDSDMTSHQNRLHTYLNYYLFAFQRNEDGYFSASNCVSQESIATLCDPETVAGIQGNQLANAIEYTLGLAQSSYRNLLKMKIRTMQDFEILNRKTFQILLTVSGDPLDVLADENIFRKKLYKKLSPEEREKITFLYEWED